MEINMPKFMGCSKSSSNRDKCLKQERSQPNFISQETRKQKQMKPTVSKERK